MVTIRPRRNLKRVASPSALVIGLMAAAFGAVLALRLLIPTDWDPSVFAAFGEEALPTLDYARSRVGEVVTRPLQGHDGKFFFVQANDPFLLDPDANARVLDRPTYRSQRALYPIIAGIGGGLPAGGVLWGLVVTNLIALGAGSAALAEYANHMGLSRWFGLAFALNPALISELSIDGAGIVALAFVVGGVLALVKGRVGLAMGLLAAACLTREVMLLAVAGLSTWLWLDYRRSQAVKLAVVPAVVVLSWGAYVRIRLPNGMGLAEVQEIGAPFAGLFEAGQRWLDDPRFMLVGALIAVCLGLFASQLIRGRRDALAWASIGFVPMAVLLTAQVWTASFDIARAVSPVLTALVVNPSSVRPRNRPEQDMDA